MIPTGDDWRIRKAPVVWRSVPAPYNAYEVSSDGRVRRGGKELKLKVGATGYLTVNLCHASVQKTFRINRLICEVFHGPPPFPKAEAAHEDGQRANNCAHNLAWKGRQENMDDQIRHGTRRTGEKHWNAKLTQDDVTQIRRLRADGVSLRKLGAMFHISSGHVVSLARGDYW